MKLVYLSKEDWEHVSIVINTLNLIGDINGKKRSFVRDNTFSDYQGYLVHKDKKSHSLTYTMHSAFQNKKTFTDDTYQGQIQDSP